MEWKRCVISLDNSSLRFNKLLTMICVVERWSLRVRRQRFPPHTASLQANFNETETKETMLA